MAKDGQVQSGVKWISISMVGTRGARLLSTLVLARLLAPEMFGIIGMAHITLEILQRVREMGFGAAYIQRQESDPTVDRLAANTTFWLGVAINIFLFIAVFFMAPMIGTFFHSESAQGVLQALSFGLLIDAVVTMPTLVLQKRLEFKRLAICEVIQALSYGVFAIALAFIDFGVWSLVWGQLISKMIFMGCLVIASPWRPRFEFSGCIARELFRFGKYLWAFVILSGVGDALDKIVVGRYYGEEQLGFYSMAFLLATLPATNITALINRLTFPLFSKIQRDQPELRRMLGSTLAHVSLLAFPISLGILLVAPLVVSALLTERWAPVVPLVEVLCLYGLVLSVAAVTGPALQAIGKPNVIFYTSIVHHLVKIALLVAFREFGPLGICYAVVIPILVSSSIAFILIIRNLQFPIWELLMPILRPAVAAGVMYFGVRLLILSWGETQAVSQGTMLAVAVLAGVCFYVGVSFLVNRSLLVEFARALNQMLGNQRAHVDS